MPHRDNQLFDARVINNNSMYVKIETHVRQSF